MTSDDPRVPLSSPARRVPPVKPVGRRVTIVRAAGASPSRGEVLAALPAAAAVVGSVALGAVLWAAGRGGRMIERYEADATAALLAGDYRTARVCFERLLQSRPSDPGYRYGLAASQHGLGRSANPTLPRDRVGSDR